MKKFLAVATALSALAAGDAVAANATSTFTVSTKVNPACTISAANLVFPDYDPFAAADTTGTSTVTLTCSKNTSYSVTLSPGSSTTFPATRTMKGTGTHTIDYNIFTEVAHTNVWGDSSGGVAVANFAPSKAPFNLTMYGNITLGQDVYVDNYSDSITATVTF